MKKSSKISEKSREDETLYSRDASAHVSEDAEISESEVPHESARKRKRRLAKEAKREQSRLRTLERAAELGRSLEPRRWTAFTAEKRNQFITLYREGASIKEAADIVGVCFSTVFTHLRKNEKFKKRFEAAKNIHLNTLEDHLVRMATGNAKGNVIALFGVLRANRPEKWRESAKLEHTGSVFVTTPDSLQEARLRAQKAREEAAQEPTIQ